MMTNRTEVKVRIPTSVGPLAVIGTHQGVTEIYFEGPDARGRRATSAPSSDSGRPPADIPQPVRDAVLQLEQYMRGKRRAFDFKMLYNGTEFRRRVWSYLLSIPLGETRTYGEVARAIGQPKAARAVGGAVGSNPISVAIPCHRVVGAGGQGGGYGGGMAAKQFLLRLEGGFPSESPTETGQKGSIR